MGLKFSLLIMCRLSISYLKHMGSEVFQISEISGFWNICIFVGRLSWGWDSSQNTKFISALYRTYTHSPVVQYFQCACVLNQLSLGVRCGILHFWYPLDTQVLDFGAFQIKDIQHVVGGISESKGKLLGTRCFNALPVVGTNSGQSRRIQLRRGLEMDVEMND